VSELTAERASSPSGAGRRLPAIWLVAAYALVFAGFARVLDLSWAELSPVQAFAAVDARAPRLVLTRWDSPSAHLSATSNADGVHLWGSGFRGAGAGLAIESSMIEAPCPLAIPHVHPKLPPAEELVVSLEAKSALPNSSLAVAVTEAGAARGRPRARFAPKAPLSAVWQAIELPLREMHPPGPNGFYPGAISAVVLRGFPPTALDLWLRHMRVLRVPIPASPQ
jgi:hypothetical protein